MNTHHLPLRPNVCMLVVNHKGEIFLGERHGESGKWQFPQGGVESELTLEENVLKELSEELGAESNKFQIVKKLNHTHEYNFRNPPAYAKDKWRGQSQTFWVVKFLGKDSDIKLDKNTPEFMNFKWVSVDDISTLVEPVRLPGYDGALKEYRSSFLPK